MSTPEEYAKDCDAGPSCKSVKELTGKDDLGGATYVKFEVDGCPPEEDDQVTLKVGDDALDAHVFGGISVFLLMMIIAASCGVMVLIVIIVIAACAKKKEEVVFDTETELEEVTTPRSPKQKLRYEQ